MMYSEDSEDRPEYSRVVSLRKQLAPAGVHIPNKAERKELARLMQKSGQTEAEVRAEKTNRQKLAKARKSMSQPKGNAFRLKVRELRNRFSKELGVQINDPRITRAAETAAGRRRISIFEDHPADVQLASLRKQMGIPEPVKSDAF